MKLIDAYNLLVNDGITDNYRYFSEVYKLYGFADDKPLKEYLDFIDHEPAHWMRGFPAKLTTKLAFSKPKTALIKLLKKQSVMQALGTEYVTRIHDVVWNTFKREADAILEERGGSGSAASPVKVEKVEDGGDVGSVGSVESEETHPIPPLPFRKASHSQHSSAPSLDIEEVVFDTEVPSKLLREEDEDRVAFLKEVLMRMASTLPPGHADAFRLLVSRV